MIFVDTSAWFAAFVPNDPDHHRAVEWLSTNVESLLTTDYVLDELLTLLRVCGEYERALVAGDSLLKQESASLAWITPADVISAWVVFSQYRDKQWSFTDCVSKVVIERKQITTAFAFDEHFRQFGVVAVVPS